MLLFWDVDHSLLTKEIADELFEAISGKSWKLTSYNERLLRLNGMVCSCRVSMDPRE
ncbi:MAG: hypothetical protein AB9897_06535 [Anaerolineaceae bacterium]